jgi:hypothetical protein
MYACMHALINVAIKMHGFGHSCNLAFCEASGSIIYNTMDRLLFDKMR